jgi:hypothetical protein
MWARGMGGGGGGGGRSLARDALDRNRRERLAREGPQRPPSERHDELLRDGQEIAAALAERLPAQTREALSSPPPAGQSPDDAVRQRCQAMLQMNQQSLRARGDGAGATGGAFLSRCQRFPMELFQCTDRGEEGRSDPNCRQHFARLDREVRTLRTEGRDVEHPDQRIDTLVTDRWETEREQVAPETLAPETVD